MPSALLSCNPPLSPLRQTGPNPFLLVKMSHNPTSPLSTFDTIFNSALDAYKRRTKADLTSDPLLPRLQACDSPDAVLTVLAEQFSAFTKSQGDDDKIKKWLAPTVNVLLGFSAVIGRGVSLVFSPASVIFAGIGVLLLAAKDVIARQETLIALFSRIEYFFQRLEIHMEVQPTAAMMEIITKIMVEVLSILGIATKDMKRGRFKKFLKKLFGGTDVEDALRSLDNLTQEESRMAAAELRKAVHVVDGRVLQVDEHVQGVRRDMEGVSTKVQDVQDTVQGVGVGVTSIGHKVEDVSCSVQGVDDKVEQINRNQLKNSLQKWLSPSYPYSYPSTNQNEARNKHHEGSAEWFFRGSIYNQWKSADSFLWIHGKPGSGKSILCSGIIEDIQTLCDSGKAFIGYFYFDFRDTDKQRRHNLLSSLLIQLSAQSDHCYNILARLHSKHNGGVHKPSDRAMMDCLKEMLIVSDQGPTYIIMDALDECPRTSGIPSPREEVLFLVKELVGLRRPNLHVCVTSRPEVDIKGVLQPLCSHPVSLHDETGQKQDIINYVSHVVRSDDLRKKWRPGDANLVIKTLSEKADGMFRWVFLQLEILRQCFPSSVRDGLQELPEDLDETYERVLKEIRKPNQLHTLRLIQCLVVAARPLRIEELAEVLAIDFDSEVTARLNPDWRWPDQESAVMSACSSLISIVNDGDSRVVQFSHFSVKEFLISQRLAKSSQGISRFHIELGPAHTILAQACLCVLLRLDDYVDHDSLENYPLARYAAQYWFKHARFENVSSHVEEGMDCLFDADKPYFGIWLSIHNCDSPRRSRRTQPSKPDGVPLYYAARLGFRDLVKRLLAKHPEDIKARCGSCVTPLHAAVAGGHIDAVSLLIEYFPDLEIRGRWDQTPLHRASWDGHLEVAQLLLSRGADVKARDHRGWTPFYAAVHPKGQRPNPTARGITTWTR
ncbi:hypothetical protein BC826DRAFT_135232 [Russula brevipes]|nr:hypothetical protein BC826DRAFT_135232 [Russula brevipes]